MAATPTGERRARVDVEGSALRIVVPARFHRSGFIPVLIFAAGWFAFWIDTIVDTRAAGTGATDVVVAAALIVVGVCFFVPTLLWVPLGRDDVLVTTDAVVLRRRFGLLLGWSRRLDADQIDSIRVDDFPPRPWYYFMGEFTLAGPGRSGAVDIEAGGKTRSFGEVGTAEAEDLVRRICAQLGRPAAEPE